MHLPFLDDASTASRSTPVVFPAMALSNRAVLRMRMVSRLLFGGLRDRVGLSGSRPDGPRLIVGSGDGFRKDDAIRDRLLDLLRDQFAIVATVDSNNQNKCSVADENSCVTNSGTSTSGPIWRGIDHLEESAGNLFVALHASAAPDEAVVHVRPAFDYNQRTPFPFERCASFEVTTATIDAYEHCVGALLLSMSPISHQDSEQSDDILAERISRISDDFNAKIKETLAQSDVAEQLMIWQTYATCLHWLGSHGNRADLLVEATRYYHVCLNPLSRHTTPLLWTTIQINLGVALCNIDHIASSPLRLRQAVQAFQCGLSAISDRQAPLLKSALYVNLGHANLKLYQISLEREYIELAIDAFESALRDQPRDQAPSRWASVCEGLGTALRELGAATNDPQALVQSIKTYQFALDKRGQDKPSPASNLTAINLGRTLCLLGALQSGSYRLLAGIEILRRASQEIDREREPHLWLGTQDAMGSALLVAGRRERRAEYLSEAIPALSASLRGLDHNNQPAEWSLTQVKIGRAYHLLGKLLGADDSQTDREAAIRCLENATQACSQARAAYEDLGAVEQAEQMSAQIDKIRLTQEWILGKDEAATG